MNIDEMLADLGKPNRPKRKIIKDMTLTEISCVDRCANIGCCGNTIIKRHEPQHQGNQEAIRKALDAIQQELDAVTKGAQKLTHGHESASFEKTLSELCPIRKNTAQDELDLLAEQHSDRTGISLFDAYDLIYKQHPDLYAKAVGESH